MSLVHEVTARLEEEGIDFALIGAAALAVHGVSRSTADTDFLTVEKKTLTRELWSEIEGTGITVRLLKGDFDDPLAGSARFSDDSNRVVDVVVGRYLWQEEIVARAERTSLGDVDVKVVRPSDLVLLKLFAGGPKDAWDIHALLASHANAKGIEDEVSQKIERLPSDSGALWKRILDELR